MQRDYYRRRYGMELHRRSALLRETIFGGVLEDTACSPSLVDLLLIISHTHTHTYM